MTVRSERKWQANNDNAVSILERISTVASTQFDVSTVGQSLSETGSDTIERRRRNAMGVVSIGGSGMAPLS